MEIYYKTRGVFNFRKVHAYGYFNKSINNGLAALQCLCKIERSREISPVNKAVLIVIIELGIYSIVNVLTFI